MTPTTKFKLAVSQALYLEYKDVLMRPDIRPPGMIESDIEGFIDRILLHSETRDIHFSWRPTLPDANDEMVL